MGLEVARQFEFLQDGEIETALALLHGHFSSVGVSLRGNEPRFKPGVSCEAHDLSRGALYRMIDIFEVIGRQTDAFELEHDSVKTWVTIRADLSQDGDEPTWTRLLDSADCSAEVIGH